MSIGDLFLDLNLNSKPFDMQMKNVGNYAQKSMARSFGGIAKLVAGAFTTGAVVSFGKSCIDLGSDLAEVQNVVDVTFPHMSGQVDEFAKNTINQFGLSETVAKRMTGTYGAMSKAFGFSEKSAYEMATTLTGLAGDVASFYNIDPTEAYTKLKSVFSGETETLKDLGIVMTQNALDQYALANGFGKTTAKMSEQEKVQLRLAFVTQQLSAAGGDFARTSDSWANKVRVLSLNFQSLKATLGQGLINVLSPLVSLLNNIIVRLQKAAQYFVAFVSLLSGNKKTSSTLGSVSSGVDKISSGLGNASSGASNLSKGVNGVGKAAKKAAKEMGALASFDDIKNLKTSSGSDSSGSGTGGGAGSSIGSDGFDLSGGTSASLDLDTSGMEKGINKMKAMWKDFTNFLTKNKAVILSLLAGIVAGFVAFEVLKNWSTITTAVSGLMTIVSAAIGTWNSFWGTLSTGGGIMNALTNVLGITGANMFAITAGIAAVTAALVYLYQTSDSFRNLVNDALSSTLNILTNLWTSILQPLFSFLSEAFTTILIPIAAFISNVFVTAVKLISSVILILYNTILIPIANFLVGLFSAALNAVIKVWEKWKPGIETLMSMLNIFWKNVIEPVADVIISIFAAAFETAQPIIEGVLNTILDVAKIVLEFFVGLFTLDMDTAWKNICDIFDKSIKNICNFFAPVAEFFSKQWGYVKDSFNNVARFVSGVFNTDWTKSLGLLGVPLNALCSTIKSIWNYIKGLFNGITTFVSGVFTGNWKKAWQGVKDIFSNIVKGFANIFKSPINAIISGINTFIGGLNKIKIPDWVPGVGGYGINLPKIPKLAQGGYVRANTPQLAMIGDNKRYGEIVSPENKMFEVMMSALKAYGLQNSSNADIQVLVSILYEILEAIKNLKLIVDGDSLSEDSRKRDRERALRTGKMIIE